ncbi:MAG: glutathione peroxidase [Bacilli bacterium]|jgi:glutathione peroxidase|nr:glutathione peroxidase [Bacilli bacterium]
MNIYDFKVMDGSNKEISMKDYEGKVLLIVNTATKCGLTPQYEALEALYEKYQDKGVEVLDFPCNQFLEQAPGTIEEINEFCTLNYNTKFPRFAKVDVNGDNTHPMFKYLKENAGKQIENDAYADFSEKVKDLQPYHGDNDIKWNFTKFLIDQKGNIVARFAPTVTPEEIGSYIEKLL